jgi:CO/xanthine dehydrogenase FAD-binding subunit
MTYWKHYRQPESVDEALASLAAAQGSARVIAGGTDLLIDFRQARQPEVDTLVDVTRIPEMQAIRLDGEAIFLGAAATHHAIVASPLLAQHAPALVEACLLIGGPQVREVATIGGNVANALPAADGAVALLALGAEGCLAGKQGRRWVPMEALFLSPGTPAFDRNHQILVGFRIPLRSEGEGSAFHRIMRPQGVAIAILNGAAWVRLDQDDKLADVRLTIAPTGPTPARARKAEDGLRGQELSVEVIAAAAVAVREEARLRTSSHRATKEYRSLLVEVVVRRVLLGAFASALAERTIAVV